MTMPSPIIDGGMSRSGGEVVSVVQWLVYWILECVKTGSSAAQTSSTFDATECSSTGLW